MVVTLVAAGVGFEPLLNLSQYRRNFDKHVVRVPRSRLGWLAQVCTLSKGQFFSFPASMVDSCWLLAEFGFEVVKGHSFDFRGLRKCLPPFSTRARQRCCCWNSWEPLPSPRSACTGLPCTGLARMWAWETYQTESVAYDHVVHDVCVSERGKASMPIHCNRSPSMATICAYLGLEDCRELCCPSGLNGRLL